MLHTQSQVEAGVASASPTPSDPILYCLLARPQVSTVVVAWRMADDGGEAARFSPLRGAGEKR